MRSGRRLQQPPSLTKIRAFHAEQRKMLPPVLCALEPCGAPFEPVISQALHDTAALLDAASAAQP
jgi:hypothetical protein